MLTVDTNVLIYAVDTQETARRPIARDLIERLARRRAFLTQQVAGEFLNVCRRRGLAAQAAIDQLEAWAGVFPIVATRWTNTVEAARLAERYRLQYWDSVLLSVAISVGGLVLFSQDMQDGFMLEGLRVIDPFRKANRAVIDSLV